MFMRWNPEQICCPRLSAYGINAAESAALRMAPPAPGRNGHRIDALLPSIVITLPRPFLAFLALVFLLPVSALALTPTVTTNPATGVTDIAAVLNGSVSPNGTSVSLYFEYGTTASYGYTATANPSSVSSSNPTTITGTPSGLQPNTTYHYRLTAWDSSGSYYYGNDVTFTTGAPATPPTLGTLSAFSISSTQATVQINSVNSGSSTATVIFDYGLTTAYGASAIFSTTISTNTTFYSPYVSLAGLSPNSTYHYRVRAINGQGTTTSGDASFSTLPPPIITTTAATAVSDLKATVNGTANGTTVQV